MKRALPFLAVAFATPLLFAAEPNSLTAEESAAGWTLLFDGKSSDGWVGVGTAKFPAKGWSVEEGTLHHSKGGGGGDIVTVASYEDFELVWEWKIASVGNSGLKYNLPDPGRGLGFEYQMLDDEKHPDGIKGGRLHQTAALYDLLEPAADKKLNPVGQWNQSRILLHGNHVEHWLNGMKTLEFELSSPPLTAAIERSKYKNIAKFGVKTKSPLLLQDHGDEVWVRSIKLRVPSAQ